MAEESVDDGTRVISVIVVARKAQARKGLVELLNRDNRFVVKGNHEMLADANAEDGELLIMAPIDLGTSTEVRDVLSRGRTVVVTQPEPALHLIAAWVYGARAVLRIDTEEAELTDMIWKAAESPSQTIDHAVAWEIVNGALAETVHAPDADTLAVLQSLLDSPGRHSGKIEEMRRTLADSNDLSWALVTADVSGPAPSESDYKPDSGRPLIIELNSFEREVIELFAQAYTYEEIAGELSMSQVRVRAHMREALQRLNLPTTEASQIWASLWLSSLAEKPERLRKRVDEFMERRTHPPRY